MQGSHLKCPSQDALEGFLEDSFLYFSVLRLTKIHASPTCYTSARRTRVRVYGKAFASPWKCANHAVAFVQVKRHIGEAAVKYSSYLQQGKKVMVIMPSLEVQNWREDFAAHTALAYSTFSIMAAALECQTDSRCSQYLRQNTSQW